MFIDMLSQPDFDSYDLSTLRGGKSGNSGRNGKSLVKWSLLPCWEVVFSSVCKRLLCREMLCRVSCHFGAAFCFLGISFQSYVYLGLFFHPKAI